MEKVALITGGSSGIGLEIARILAGRDYTVLLLSRNERRLESAAAELKSFTEKVFTYACDVSSPGDLASVAVRIKERFAGLDLLVLSAGIVTVSLVSDYPSGEDLLRDVKTNLHGAMLSAYYFGPLLADGAKVIFVSSGFGLMGAAGYTSYCASKAGVINFAEAWQRELEVRNIRVYVAAPADVDTPMLKKELQDQPDWMKEQAAPRKALPAQVVAKRILKRAKGRKLLVFPSFDVYFLFLVRKILPRSWALRLLDMLFPRPGK